MAQKILAQGAFFEVFDPSASPDTWVKVGNFRGATGVRSGSRTEVDMSDMDSIAKEFALGLKDNGTMTINLLFDPLDQGQILLESLRGATVTNPFRLHVPNPAASPQFYTLQFNGYVVNTPFELNIDSNIPGSAAIRVSGDFTVVGT